MTNETSTDIESAGATRTTGGSLASILTLSIMRFHCVSGNVIGPYVLLHTHQCFVEIPITTYRAALIAGGHLI